MVTLSDGIGQDLMVFNYQFPRLAMVCPEGIRVLAFPIFLIEEIVCLSALYCSDCNFRRNIFYINHSLHSSPILNPPFDIFRYHFRMISHTTNYENHNFSNIVYNYTVFVASISSVSLDSLHLAVFYFLDIHFCSNLELILFLEPF